eukprot:6205719-Heterocapsa_arctica.AAC.1
MRPALLQNVSRTSLSNCWSAVVWRCGEVKVRGVRCVFYARIALFKARSRTRPRLYARGGVETRWRVHTDCVCRPASFRPEYFMGATT